ncbi:MAG: hypothetical protein ABR94_00325 [Sphingobacteriales bacterium BACL12 MAG-120802-bin5]|jgi:acetyl/propionyl-CoA carboxylase alpha subunit|nr:MAG: hypothetical protein ABR94_00325 [Sphingobacteriales bacterium BACL12 MAG-120802-bin5]
MRRVTVNQSASFAVSGFEVDGVEEAVDMQQTGARFWHILHKGRSYSVELIRRNAEDKTMTLRVNNQVYTVSVKDKMDQLLEQMGLGAAGAGKLKNLKAPMPGLVLDIRVEPGATVAKGDPLIVLEAMKMENVLKAEGEGVVKTIEVKKSQNVEKGLVMITFE